MSLFCIICAYTYMLDHTSVLTHLKSVELVFQLGLIINELLVELLLILFHLVLSDLNLVQNSTRPRQGVPSKQYVSTQSNMSSTYMYMYY